MTLRNYSNAQATALSAGCSNADTVVTVDDASSMPSAPFTVIIDYGNTTEEVVTVTTKNVNILTITRGQDSTTAFAHNSAAPVVHGISARDPREANSHVNAATGVHGITGSVVGTSDVQTLTNKTLTAPQINAGQADGLVLRPGAGVDPLTVQNTAGVQVGNINPNGSLGASGIFLTDDGGATPTMRITGSAAQTQNVLEVQTSAGTRLVTIDSAGGVMAANLTASATNPRPPFSHREAATSQSVPGTGVDQPMYLATTVDQNYDWLYTVGTFTVPLAGRYHVDAGAQFNGNGSTGGGRYFKLRKNGTTDAQIIGQTANVAENASRDMYVTFSRTFTLAANDVLSFYLASNSGGACGTVAGTGTFVTIDWVGPA